MENGAGSYRRFLSGEKNAFTEIVAMYGDALTFFALGIVGDYAAAEDVMMDTFVSLIVKKRRIGDERAFKTYLFRTAHNKAVDYLRAHKRLLPLATAENIADAKLCEAAVLKNEKDKELYACIETLPVQYRDALYLVYFEELSVDDAGKVLGKSVKQVYNLLSRAKSSLRTLLSKEDMNYERL